MNIRIDTAKKYNLGIIRRLSPDNFTDLESALLDEIIYEENEDILMVIDYILKEKEAFDHTSKNRKNGFSIKIFPVASNLYNAFNNFESLKFLIWLCRKKIIKNLFLPYKIRKKNDVCIDIAYNGLLFFGAFNCLQQYSEDPDSIEKSMIKFEVIDLDKFGKVANDFKKRYTLKQENFKKGIIEVEGLVIFESDKIKITYANGKMLVNGNIIHSFNKGIPKKLWDYGQNKDTLLVPFGSYKELEIDQQKVNDSINKTHRTILFDKIKTKCEKESLNLPENFHEKLLRPEIAEGLFLFKNR